ncbi:MAG: ATP phosphoribosyltransferase [Planctomycetota bacterium]|nr:MAG: ATP phosphoribosyltransferase [Planctomycetota bacterium]
MAPTRSNSTLRLALPTGRMQAGVLALLHEAGVQVHTTARNYRPAVSIPDVQAKFLKPQSIVEMLHGGSRDLGFAGRDWVVELDAELVELFDTGLDPVRMVAAAPRSLLEDGELPQRPLIVASEYERLSRRWMADRQLDATFLRAFGATEVFPPEDADCIVDNTATGSTLAANDLEIVDELMTSSTRLYANPRSLDEPWTRRRIDDVVTLVRSVIEARRRVMVEVNVTRDRLEALIAVLPAMRRPTVSALHNGQDLAVKAAVPREELPTIIPRLKAAGGTDVVVTNPSQIIP